MSRGQRIRYLRTTDGVKLAWAEAGAGPCLIQASHWLSHLEYEWESPVWRPQVRVVLHLPILRHDRDVVGERASHSWSVSQALAGTTGLTMSPTSSA